MKKLLLALILLLISPAYLFAGGFCAETRVSYYEGLVVIRLACTGDAVDGSIPNTALSSASMSMILGTHYLYTVSAYPTSGGTAPDAADVFLLMNGEDLLGSTDGGTTANKGANLIHATLTKTTFPYNGTNSSPWFPPITNTLTVKVSNQATASANYTIEIVGAR